MSASRIIQRVLTAVLLLLLVLLFLNVIRDQVLIADSVHAPKALNGVLDARGWNPETDGILDLAGEWEFYWEEFVYADKEALQDPIYIQQPRLWNHLNLPGEYFPPDSYASLRLRVLIDNDWPDRIGFTILETANSMRFYVNGTLLANAGIPGTDISSTDHRLRPRSAEYIRHGTEELDLILHIANYIDREGGRKRPLYIGKVQDTLNVRQRGLLYEGLIGGSLLMIGLYNLILFAVNRKQRLPLAFFFVCLFFAAFILLAGERVLLLLFDIPFSIFGKLWFLSYYFMPVSMAVFLHFLFPNDSQGFVWKGLLLFASVYSLITMILPFDRAIDLLSVYHLATFTTAIYLITVIALAIIRNRPYAYAFLLASILLFATSINDILYAENIIVSVFLAPFGILGFAIALSVVISQHFAETYRREESLGNDLKQYSDNLEKLVGQRSQQVQKRKKELDTSIEYAERIQKSTLTSDSELKRIFPDHFIIYMPRDTVGGDFYWGSAKVAGEGYIAIGDCTGHGIPGALMSMLSSSILDQIIQVSQSDFASSPAAILSELHNGVRRNLQQKGGSNLNDGLDIGIIHSGQSILQFAGAHMGLYLVRRGSGVEFFPGSRKGAGYIRTALDYEFQSAQIELKKNDIFYLLSDGLIDQNGGGKNHPFGKRRFIQLLESIQEVPFQQQKSRILEALEQYQNGNPQRDDICVFAAQIQ
ncbi:PP2C family protein-serine/threonine phosphatase [Spirochaeta dissipatitropha]